MPSRYRMAWLFVALGFVCVGCAGETPVYDVSGAVTFNGQPLPDGEIVFVAEDGRMSESSQIKEGRYTLKARAGKQIVRIRAMKVKPGGARDAFGAPAPEDYLPARYNTSSNLTVDVTAAGPRQFDFPLTSD